MIKFIILFAIFFSTLLYSHGGRTNSEGCHNQRGGTYHCHGKKTNSKEQVTEKSNSKEGYNCQREYCKYMASCEEAYYKLTKCGHRSLDRDYDGVPCENICPGG